MQEGGRGWLMQEGGRGWLPSLFAKRSEDSHNFPGYQCGMVRELFRS